MNRPNSWRRTIDRGARRPIYWRNEYQAGADETLEVRYRLYCDAMQSLDREPDDFDTWLNK